ncbi:MAG: sensor histidine kinase [Pedosphaera sp.]|nr:sensor histidine kinase [Pedosphaera sp.]
MTGGNTQMIMNQIDEFAPAETLDQLLGTCQQLRHLFGRANTALEREKLFLARQLHDDFAQKLTALSIEMTLLDHTLGAGDPVETSAEAVRQRLKNMSSVVASLIKSTRKLTTELRPKVLEEFGLVAGLQWQAQEFTNRTGIKCEFISESDDLGIDLQRSTEIFRILQEILLNVARHSRATRVQINISTETETLFVRVQDDGCGISEDDISSSESLGLAEIRERIHLLGGELKIDGVPSDGTLVTIEVPMTSLSAGLVSSQ